MRSISSKEPAGVNPMLGVLTQDWGVSVEETLKTETSLIAFGTQNRRPVVLKISKPGGDERQSGGVLKSFNGNGVVRVYEHVAGAVLMERIIPGTPLSSLVLNGRDTEATEILIGVLQKMIPSIAHLAGIATVESWFKGFIRYAASGDTQIPRDLVQHARNVYCELCSTQTRPRILHGDLHYDNVLFDEGRGWLAIDPKGVFGEIEYEIGAAIRNPIQKPELFASAIIAQRRIERIAEALGLNAGRVLAWSYAQAVLSAIWRWEDGFPIGRDNSFLMLARELRPLVT